MAVLNTPNIAEIAPEINILSVSAVAELGEARPNVFEHALHNPDSQIGQFTLSNLAAQGAGNSNTAQAQLREKAKRAGKERQNNSDAHTILANDAILQDAVSDFLNAEFGHYINKALGDFLLAQTDEERAKIHKDMMDEIMPALRKKFPDAPEEKLKDMAEQHIEDVYTAKLQKDLGLSEEDARARAKEELADASKYNEVAAELKQTYADNPELQSLMFSFESENQKLGKIEDEITQIKASLDEINEDIYNGHHSGQIMSWLSMQLDEKETQLAEQTQRVAELENQLESLSGDNVAHAYLEMNTKASADYLNDLNAQQSELQNLYESKQQLVQKAANQVTSETSTKEQIADRMEHSATTQSCTGSTLFNAASLDIFGEENEMTAAMDDDFKTRMQIDTIAAGATGQEIRDLDEQIKNLETEVQTTENTSEQDAETQQTENLTLEAPSPEDMAKQAELANAARNYADQVRGHPVSDADIEMHFGELSESQRDLVIAELEREGVELTDDVYASNEPAPEVDNNPEPNTTPASEQDEYKYAQNGGPGMSFGGMGVG